ncbi:hydrolase-like protein [Arabis alpina]|uniref:GPI inositol-deacylase n=1 Tax=Arabis alpina TaxID=50452 RepID=A0A087G7Y9_ARAAL|nr:hydrolase-like protein [Arabis alpina]
MASAIVTSIRLRPSFSTATSPSSGDFKHRPAVILPGLGNNSGDYKKLEVTLGEYGVPVVVAAVSRIDWLRNAAGLVDPAYWRGTLRPRPVLDWYLKRIDDAVREANELARGQRLSLIGHSAGGWLARVYMEEYGNSDISLLLTLGTPHLPPPRGQSGVIDQTRGLLYYVEEHCAKAVYTPELRYVCIAGRYIRGARLVNNADADVESDVTVGINGGEAISELAAIASDKKRGLVVSSGPSFRARFVGQGYKQVCGKADVWGDGVVPEVSGHLEGALNVTFDGVYHSPVGSDDTTRPWYGSPDIVKDWIHHLLE